MKFLWKLSASRGHLSDYILKKLGFEVYLRTKPFLGMQIYVNLIFEICFKAFCGR